MTDARPEIRPAEAHAQLSRFHVVDVREPHEFQGALGHIPGAESIPLGRIDAAAERLRGGREVLAVCRSGQRSARACQRLAELGVAPPTNLAGGMIAWSREGLPVERRAMESLEQLLGSLGAWLAQVTGRNLLEAQHRLEALLQEAGASWDEPTAAGVDRALDGLRASFEARQPAPPDLDLVLQAYRKDLALL